jgi:hypothetical protein
VLPLSLPVNHPRKRKLPTDATAQKSLCSCTCAQFICLTGGGEEKTGYRRVAGKRAKWGDTVAAHLARRNVQPTSLSQRSPPANVAKFAAAGGCGRSQTGVRVGRVSGAIDGHSSLCLVRPLSAGRSLYGRRNPQRCSRRYPNGHASNPMPHQSNVGAKDTCMRVPVTCARADMQPSACSQPAVR